MGRGGTLLLLFLALTHCLPTPGLAQLSYNYYASTCPNVESLVRNAVRVKLRQTNITIPGTIRLFFHDCFVEGCDASIMIFSTPNNQAEKDSPDNLSLAGDGFDTVMKAKAAVDADTKCRNKVSCADILALATRDAIVLAGGPSYAVEMGRKDGLTSMAKNVIGKLPQPSFNLDQLNALFSSHGLTQTDMIALSGAHTVGFSHCSRFSDRIYKSNNGADPFLNPAYAAALRGECPRNVDFRVAVALDPITPNTFDNTYYKNLQKGAGLLTSDQALFTSSRSRPTVNAFAQDKLAFEKAFVTAITKLGRVGIKTGSQGNIRHDCSKFN